MPQVALEFVPPAAPLALLGSTERPRLRQSSPPAAGLRPRAMLTSAQGPRSLAGWSEAAGLEDDEGRWTSVHAADRALATARDGSRLAMCSAMERILRVRSYVEFRLLLGMQGVTTPRRACCLPDFPPPLRDELLVALGGRLMAIPYPEQVLAIRDFIAFTPGAGVRGLLATLRAAACLGAEGLRRREQSLVDPGGAAHGAVSRGENTHAVARRFALSGPEAMETLEETAMPRALEAVSAGTSVRVAADSLGISDPARLERLERHATGHVGIKAVRMGECPQAVAQRLGIRLPGCVLALRHHAALRMVMQGRSVVDAARTHGIDRPGSLLGLEIVATDVASNAMEHHGQHVHQVAERLGITRPALLQRLEARAAHSVGVDALRRGETVAAVAQRLGIRTPEVLAYLRDAAVVLGAVTRSAP